MLPKKAKPAALRKIGEQNGVSQRDLSRRFQWLGLTNLEARMGRKAADRWLRHMKDLIRITRNSSILRAMAVDRFYQVVDEIKDFHSREFSEFEVMKLLGVGKPQLEF